MIHLRNDVYGLSNGGLQSTEEEWAKVSAGKEALKKILDEDAHDSAEDLQEKLQSPALLLNATKTTGPTILSPLFDTIKMQVVRKMQKPTNQPYWAEWINGAIHMSANLTGFTTVQSSTFIAKKEKSKLSLYISERRYEHLRKVGLL